MARIIGIGNYLENIGTDVPDLKPLLKTTLGTSVRRIDRFIQLALIGAARCIQSAKGIELSSDTAIYLASGRGDMEITVEVQRDLFVNGHEPKPINFINTVSNAASFYIAQNFGLCGRNQFIANRHWAFEVALQSALLDLELGKISSALVGVVDVVVPPIAEHRQRLGLEESAALAEGSHWLWLDNESSSARSLGTVECVRHFADRSELLAWAPTLRNEHSRIVCSGGQFIADDVISVLRESGNCAGEFNYHRHLNNHSGEMGYYDSQSGRAISLFLQSSESNETLLHVNSDSLQRYMAMVARKN